MKSLFKVLYELSQGNSLMINSCMSFRMTTDLYKRQVRFKKYKVVDQGSVVSDVTLCSGEVIEYDDLIKERDLDFILPIELNEKENPYEVIEYLYGLFYCSVPDRSAVQKKQNFIAKGLNDFGANDFTGMRRSEIQPLLELYVLLAGMKGWITWKDDKLFFWKGEHKSLYIYRKWILGY